MKRLPRLPVWLAGLAAASIAAAGTPDDLVTQVRQNRRELFRSFIAPPTGESAALELEATIERIRAIRMERRPSDRNVTAPGPTRAAPAPESQAPGTPTPHKESPVVTPEDLERMRRLPTDRIGDPMALADSLFLAGHHREAYSFYETAVKADRDKKTKAWALFQMANCHRDGDSATSIALYARVMAEYGDSPWAQVAKTYHSLLEERRAAQAAENEQAATQEAAPQTAAPEKSPKE